VAGVRTGLRQEQIDHELISPIPAIPSNVAAGVLTGFYYMQLILILIRKGFEIKEFREKLLMIKCFPVRTSVMILFYLKYQ